MHTEENRAHISPLLRAGGTIIGAILCAIGAAVLFFIAAVLNVLNDGFSFQFFLTALSFAGAIVGFLLPRQMIHSLWFFLPEIFDPS